MIWGRILFFVVVGLRSSLCWRQPSEVKVAQRCLTLCHPVDSTVRGILQARILECVAIPSPGDLPNTRIKLRSPALQADSLPDKSHSQFLEVTVSCPLILPYTSHNKEAAF